MNKDILNYQRKVLGIMCALLAPCSILFGLFGDNLPEWYCSISATYYANSKICMIGLLFATGVFFYTYSGYSLIDRIFSYIQATAALGVITFPCLTPEVSGKVGLFGLPVEISYIFHCISASVLFIAFATNIMFLFTKSDGNPTPQKKIRNKIYYICGGIIYLFAILQGLSSFFKFPSWLPITWFNEFFMLEAYAMAWLTKAGMFKKFND